MNERVMNTNAVPSFLLETLRTNRVRVSERNNVITIEPAEETVYRCPLRGIAKGGSLTVEKFLGMKQEEKELENANERRLHS